MEWDKCIRMIQKYLEDGPLVVLGSGASIPYGLPSMSGLADEIKKSDRVNVDSHYPLFCEAVNKKGLEGAIDVASLQPATKDEIRLVVWQSVNEKDLHFFDKHPTEPPQSLTCLLEKILAPTPNHAVVVTTNYDRLVEYAVDGIKASAVTGFEGNLIRRLELASSSVFRKRVHSRERVVDIWKVHGSIDWFRSYDGTIVSLPFSRAVPNNMEPLIIPPGKGKYSKTHDEPFRTVISEADKAFVKASSYLCIGYGFNDDHIQPKLLEEISKGKPIVILAKSITSACKKHVIEAGIAKYLIFEEADSEHTKVYGNGWTSIYEGQFWNLENFMKIW